MYTTYTNGDLEDDFCFTHFGLTNTASCANSGLGPCLEIDASQTGGLLARTTSANYQYEEIRT
jgi:hypothetical protein